MFGRFCSKRTSANSRSVLFSERSEADIKRMTVERHVRLGVGLVLIPGPLIQHYSGHFRPERTLDLVPWAITLMVSSWLWLLGGKVALTAFMVRATFFGMDRGYSQLPGAEHYRVGSSVNNTGTGAGTPSAFNQDRTTGSPSPKSSRHPTAVPDSKTPLAGCYTAVWRC